MASGELEFRILGGLEVTRGGVVVPLGSRKQRMLLAVLVLHVGEPVSTDVLADALWGDEPPSAASTSLQTYVSQLRKLLGADAILTGAGGYQLAVDQGAVDACAFERTVEAGTRELEDGRWRAAAETFARALGAWHGPALADFRYDGFALAPAARLEELRLTAVEQRIAAELELGRHAELVGELQSLICDHPLREHLRRHLMVALYRDGRQADALAAYHEGRTALDALGLDPSPELQRLERAILNQDPELATGERRVSKQPRTPAPATPIIGRGAELEAILQLLAETPLRLLTLTGPGGTGKTRLALEVLDAVQDRYPDGVAFVPLAPIEDPDLVVSTIAQTLSVGESPGESGLEALVEHLRGKEMLLVLDNFEQLQRASPVVSSLLAGSDTLELLVTSRSRLGIAGEQEYPVPPLTLPDPTNTADSIADSEAVALLVARARAIKPGFALTEENAPVLAHICVEVDGLPLAIELAAARLKLLPPQDLLDRLGERLRLLTGGGSDRPERQQTLRATIEWSYRLLDPDEQTLFARLAIFSGGCTLESAEAICGGDLDVLEGVASLLDKSLLWHREAPEGSRLSMLQTIREFALELLATRPDRGELLRRHAGYFLDLVERSAAELQGPDQVVWLQRLESEHDNMRAALAWLFEDGAVEWAIRLAAASWRFWYSRGHLYEGRKWLELLLGSAVGSEPSLARAQALFASGSLAKNQGDYDAAIAAFEESLALFRAYEDEDGVATVLSALGGSLAWEGQYEAARSLLEESLAIKRALDERWGVGAALINLGFVAHQLAEYDRAHDLYAESLSIKRELGDKQGIAICLHNLGELELSVGRLDLGREKLEESCAVFEELGEKWGIATALRALGKVELDRGDHRAAMDLLTSSLVGFRDLGDRAAGLQTLEELALVAMQEGAYERAATLWGAAESLRESVRSPRTQSDFARYEPALASALEEVGEAAWLEALAGGAALAFEEAVDYALANKGAMQWAEHGVRGT
jgi:predicted ATPase/DNA-binding SARP family transcriptional activator